MTVSIAIHLYGKLRRYGPQPDRDRECVIATSADPGITVGRLLQGVGVPLDEVSNVFLDGTYDQLALDKPMDGVSRIGVFPRDMGLLYV